MYKFDFYSVGVDWATSHKDHTIFMIVCLKNTIILVIIYDAYIICELIVTPNDFINENEKINAFINKILGLIDNFENFEQAICFMIIKQEQQLID